MLSSLKSRLNLGLAGGIALLAAAAVALGNCPPPGSGAAGVAQWAEDNCGENDCIANPATTCNGNFTIELIDVDRDGDLVTYAYRVCNIGSQQAVSHLAIGLGGIDCLGEGFELDDLVVGGTFQNQAVDVEIGLDPTTQIVGMKINVPAAWPGGGTGTCWVFTFTLDESVLAEGCELGTGCVLSATKAGNEDIQNPDRSSPGYACISGPICLCGSQGLDEGCSPGYWRNHQPSWPAHIRPKHLVGTYFPSSQFHLDDKLRQAIRYGGGPALRGGEQILLRAATAALLNAGHPDVDYPHTQAEVEFMVNTALDTRHRATYLQLASYLDELNNLGCPLN